MFPRQVITFRLPYTAVALEWELYVSAAEIGRGARIGTVLAADVPDAGSAAAAGDMRSLPASSRFKIALIPSTYLDTSLSASSWTQTGSRSCGSKGLDTAGASCAGRGRLGGLPGRVLPPPPRCSSCSPHPFPPPPSMQAMKSRCWAWRRWRRS